MNGFAEPPVILSTPGKEVRGNIRPGDGTKTRRKRVVSVWTGPKRETNRGGRVGPEAGPVQAADGKLAVAEGTVVAGLHGKKALAG
jgi:hypothetical protein